MEKVDYKRAKFSGFLDVLGFLAALVMTAGYIVVDLVKVSGLPDGITNFWGKLSDGVEKAFDGVFLRWLDGLPKYPGLPFAVLFGILALLFLIMSIASFKQGNSVLKRGGIVFAGILALLLFVGCAFLFAESWKEALEAGLLNVKLVKWYLLIPCAFFLLQMILKFSAHARAY